MLAAAGMLAADYIAVGVGVGVAVEERTAGTDCGYIAAAVHLHFVLEMTVQNYTNLGYLTLESADHPSYYCAA